MVVETMEVCTFEYTGKAKFFWDNPIRSAFLCGLTIMGDPTACDDLSVDRILFTVWGTPQQMYNFIAMSDMCSIRKIA